VKVMEKVRDRMTNITRGEGGQGGVHFGEEGLKECHKITGRVLRKPSESREQTTDKFVTLDAYLTPQNKLKIEKGEAAVVGGETGIGETWIGEATIGEKGIEWEKEHDYPSTKKMRDEFLFTERP